MRKNRLFPVVLFAFITLLLAGCKHEPAAGPDGGSNPPPPPPPPPSSNCDPDTVYFQNAVLPLFQSNCAKSGCHDVATAQEGVILNNYYNIFTTGEVEPGNPNSSKVYEVLLKDGEDRMPPPPNQALTQAQISTIATWIAQGALNNICDSTGCDTSNVTYSGTIQLVISLYCIGCHSGTNPAYSINLSTYDGVSAVANSGRLMGALRWETGFFPMPKNGNQLSACQISQFQKWIDTGMPY